MNKSVVPVQSKEDPFTENHNSSDGSSNIGGRGSQKIVIPDDVIETPEKNPSDKAYKKNPDYGETFSPNTSQHGESGYLSVIPDNQEGESESSDSQVITLEQGKETSKSKRKKPKDPKKNPNQKQGGCTDNACCSLF